MMRVLHVDLETAPNIAHVWQLWDVNVSLNQLIVPSYILCWAAKWDGERDVHFARVRHDARGGVVPASRRVMLERIHALLSQADAVVTYNGARFDLPKLRGEFIAAGLDPPAPFKSIDLFLTARRLGYPSSKLAYVAQALGVGSKVKHEGHDLWKACMADDEAAWGRMRRYNEGDVRLQERVYHRLRPWIAGHPNAGLYVDGDDPVCPRCASKRLQRRGFAAKNERKFQRFQCSGCGGWSTAAKADGEATTRRAL